MEFYNSSGPKVFLYENQDSSETCARYANHRNEFKALTQIAKYNYEARLVKFVTRESST